MRQIRWSESAHEDLRAIAQYVGRDSKFYARRLVEKIKNAVENLQLFPEAGAQVLEWNEPSIREVYVGNYRLIYRIQTEFIYVIAIIHSARQLPKRDNPQSDEAQ